jgi:hypothetical protein
MLTFEISGVPSGVPFKHQSFIYYCASSLTSTLAFLVPVMGLVACLIPPPPSHSRSCQHGNPIFYTVLKSGRQDFLIRTVYKWLYKSLCLTRCAAFSNGNYHAMIQGKGNARPYRR